MESRLIALELSSQDLLKGQQAMRDDLATMTKTWGDFSEMYLPYLKGELVKQQERAKLRRAIIEKSLVMTIVAIAAFVGAAVWDHVLSIIHGVK